MKIKSSVFENNGLIPDEYTCEGENINPSLQIFDVPDKAQSLALIMDDPDAATDPDGSGKTFDHWLIWNLEPSTKEITENDWPEGSEQGINDRGEIGYTGPCPPNGTHKYYFKLFALNKKINVSPDVKKEELLKEIETCKIEEAELIGKYKKQNL